MSVAAAPPTPVPTAGLRPAAFIDRDGVVNEERDYVWRIEDFHLLPGVVQGLQRLQQAGYALVVVTNQAGIARGYYRTEDFHHLSEHLRGLLAAQGVHLDGIYHCPHHPTAGLPPWRVDCACRKPRPGMLLQAAQDLGLDLARSFIVGDKASDLQAGAAAGVRWKLLVESGHTPEPAARALADSTHPGLAEAADWVRAQADR